MIGPAGLPPEGGLHEPLPQHEVDLEGGTQRIAGVSHPRDFAAGLAQEGIVLAEIDPRAATGRMGQRLGEQGLESGLRFSQWVWEKRR
jgi:hypothetical protein